MQKSEIVSLTIFREQMYKTMIRKRVGSLRDQFVEMVEKDK